MWGIALYFLKWLGISPVMAVASLTGISESALNLLISILMSYPLAIIYHQYVRKKGEAFRNLYFTITGLDMAFYNFGWTLYHNILPIVAIYLCTKLLGPGKNHAIATFTFNMAYLLSGYLMTESESYDITWTMPHCVLTLKLIALSFDLWDGHKLLKGDQLSANNKLTALTEPPTLIELFGFVYFPACLLVGPIFSFRRYRDYITDKFPLDSDEEVYTDKAFNKLLQGLVVLVLYQVGGAIFNMNFILSEEFNDRSVIYRHFYCGFWAHFALYKYVSCWLLTEACCIRFGLSFNGVEQEGGEKSISKWDACCNIKVSKFIGATKFQHYIDSFNCNTNFFAAEYIYKRLKFLNNRHLSQFFTLLFLAVWHGVQSGYYMTFFNEFMIILMEKELETLFRASKLYSSIDWSNPIIYILVYVLLKIYTLVYMGWSLVPFDLKLFSKWWHVYSSLYFSGFILFLPWLFVYKPLFIKLLKKPHSS